MTILTAALLGAGLGGGLWSVVDTLFASNQEVPAGTRLVARVRPPGKLARLLAEAGHPRVSPIMFMVTASLVALATGAVVAWLIPIPVLAVLAVGAMGFVGFGYVRNQRESRYRRLQQAWPGLIDHLRAGIRSGSDVTTAVMALPDTLPPDIRQGVEHFRAAIDRGMDTDAALTELASRWANPVSDRICQVLRMAHEVGGTDLPSVLLQLQHSVRSDLAVRENARAAQSWIRSAALLALCAPWIVLVVIGTREQTIGAYQSVQGTVILLVGALVSVVAYRMMKSMGALPESTRWIG